MTVPGGKKNGLGGMFLMERPPEQAGGGESFPDRLKGSGADLRFCMSGRCALYYCLDDLEKSGKRRAGGAYLPAYTCETVIAPYKKAGYELLFYDIDPVNLRPRFDRELIPRISVLALCGYYGFSYYDRDFVRRCTEAGAAVVQDITHSAFSAGGIEEGADYIAGSLRKWLGIPSGGLALKRRGPFTADLLPPEEEHIRGRIACYEEQERALRGEGSEERASEIFWETEMRLRRIFDRHEGDPRSAEILRGFPWQEHIRRRRDNYRYILEQNPFTPQVRAVFPELPAGVCPSHLALYAEDRERLREGLAGRGIKTTVYWPRHGEIDLPVLKRDFPGAAWIYDHILTAPVDQRYSPGDMETLCAALRQEAAG